MKIKNIKVTAGRTFPHPLENFSNIKFELSISAEIEESENFEKALDILRVEAETLAEAHKRELIEDHKKLEALKEQRRDVERLQENIDQNQEAIKRTEAKLGTTHLKVLQGIPF